MEYLISLLSGVTVALLAYRLWPVSEGGLGMQTPTAYMPVEESEESLPFYRRLLLVISRSGPLTKYAPEMLVKRIARQLYWAQLGGKWLAWSVPELVALHSVLLVAGLVFSFLVAGDLFTTLLLAMLFVFLFNRIYLDTTARRIQRQMMSELPEFVTLLGAEVATNTALTVALARLSSGSGICAIWFRRVMRQAIGGSPFTQEGKEGALLTEAKASGEPDIIDLAFSLDRIARRGTGVKQLLEQTARATASRFIGAAQVRAEKVGTEITIPMITFFFVPYVLLLLAIMGGPLLGGNVLR